jgi:hypothetical protein
MDKWFTAPILGGSFHPIGLPNNGSVDFPWPGLDYDLMPSVSEALAVRADRATRFRDYLATVVATDFTRRVDVLENGTHPLQECIYTQTNGSQLRAVTAPNCTTECRQPKPSRRARTAWWSPCCVLGVATCGRKVRHGDRHRY